MKFPSLFTKIPKHRRFNYTPRHYDPLEEERKAREERIHKELSLKEELDGIDTGHRARIAGSFRSARKVQGKQHVDPSTNMLRLIIITLLVVWIIAYLHYGQPAVYALALLIPLYIWIRFIRR
jgi:hypothetical protein